MLTPYLEDGDLTLYHGDALTVLQGLPVGIAQTCVTSPPYWGLRDYGTGQWSGGDEACDHIAPPAGGPQPLNRPDDGGGQGMNYRRGNDGQFRDGCGKCGARRVDSQLGLEATPQEYVANMVNLFREVWRVLRDDGTLWLNLGDSYAAGKTGRGDAGREGENGFHGGGEVAAFVQQRTHPPGLKPKDLVGIPWQVAFALQTDGWYLRSDIIWAKPNPMPESVTDRPTKAHEYLFLFSKQPRYFYDADAIREPHSREWWGETVGAEYLADESRPRPRGGTGDGGKRHGNGTPAGRNRRSVWTIPTQPFPEAHFATYPEELVRPCILAGTSERGECAECGAPWTRQVEMTPEYKALLDSGKAWRDGSGKPDDYTNRQPSDHPANVPQKHVTTGWEPSCACNKYDRFFSGPTRPQLVLDPFIGSGTTSLVARKHGRRSLGIDLSLEYLAIAAKRTQQLSLLGAG